MLFYAGYASDLKSVIKIYNPSLMQIMHLDTNIDAEIVINCRDLWINSN